MFKVISATALAAGLLFAAPVAAEPFDTFHDLCFATHGDRPAAHAEAKRRGWTEIPTEALGDMAEEMFRELVMHTNFNPATGEATDGAPGLLLTGWGDGEEMMGAESVVVEICSLMSPELELEDAEQRLTALVGARAVAPDEEKMWLYSRVDGRYVSEAALQEFAGGEIEAVARQRDLYVAFAMEDDGARVLMLGAVRSVLRLREGR
ncbi:hypothetical protein [Brevundimonas sp. GCM10030266]|jgi:hypothetical protein|uniref:hypothetical protein n=1 Tax=Brevundimonas sp. GCM10030266 TaxID=3273386 RepID=UPI0036094800